MTSQSILEKYNCIEIAQLACMYFPADPKTARAEIKAQALMQSIALHDNCAQLRVGRKIKPDPDLIASIWAMLILCDGHMADVDHAPDTYPFSLRFVAEGKIYRVLPVHENMPANALHALDPAAGETALLLLLDGTVPADLIVPEGAPAIYVTYRRPDKWGKPIIRTYLDRALTEEI